MSLLTDREKQDAVAHLTMAQFANKDDLRMAQFDAIEAATIAKLVTVSMEPVAHLKFWAAQRVSPDGGVEADEGLETCRAGEVGMDGVAAEPVYTATQLAASRVQAMEECKQDKIDAECFRLWVHEAWHSPGYICRLLNDCETPDDYRAKLVPIIAARDDALRALIGGSN